MASRTTAGWRSGRSTDVGAGVTATAGELDGSDVDDPLPHATSTNDRPSRPRRLRTRGTRGTDR